MERSGNHLTIAQAKQIDLVEYISSLGIEPARISGHNYWYLSPFPDRNERTASMKVNRIKNTWKDFGDGRGGTIIDFGIYYFRCSIREFLLQLNSNPVLQPSRQILPTSNTDLIPAITILSEKTISDPRLLNYLHYRRISLAMANQYCQQITYVLNHKPFPDHNKHYVSIGFKNKAGGFELRSRGFQASTSPKEVTYLGTDLTEVGKEYLFVFEGFMDFLSYQMIHLGHQLPSSNFLISMGLVPRSLLRNPTFGHGPKRIYS